MLKTVLFINSIPDDKNVQIIKIKKNGSIGWMTSGQTNISPFINTHLFNTQVVTFDTNSTQEIELNQVHAIFNEISDADSNALALNKAENFLSNITESHPEIPFFNIPSNIKKTSRDNISKLLQNIDKLQTPKTIKIQPTTPMMVHSAIAQENLSYPVIFRKAGDHGGKSTLLINDKDEQFYSFALDGRDYYLTQFVDYQEEGIYKKTRLVIVDGEIYYRGTMLSKEWMVHAKNELYDIQLIQNSFNDFKDNQHSKIKPIIDKIHTILNLEYFGIDCYINSLDNSILIFEINASMDILQTSQKKKELLNPHILKINKAITTMILERLKS